MHRQTFVLGLSRYRLASLWMACSLLVVTAAAQKTTGSIEGTITDPTGAVVANARVTATDETSGEKANAISDGSGIFASWKCAPIRTWWWSKRRDLSRFP